jgi:hypothetical protein
MVSYRLVRIMLTTAKIYPLRFGIEEPVWTASWGEPAKGAGDDPP